MMKNRFLNFCSVMLVIFVVLGFLMSENVKAARSLKLAAYALGQTCSGIFTGGCWGGLNANTWMQNNFDFWVGGPSIVYKDISVNAGAVGGEYLALKDWAQLNSVNVEDMLLHAKIDHTTNLANSTVAFKQMDAFDNFEQTNGIMKTVDDVTYTQLNTPFSTNPYANNATLSNNIYFGYELPFDQVNFILSATRGIGISEIWEYWNGATWSTLSVDDGTVNFTTDGRVSFLPPSDWSRKIINNSNDKYFVRVRFLGGSQYPVASSIKGDDWLNGASQACRGWNSSDPSIINSGELAYNPNAGIDVSVNAHAKFRYQSRIPFWGANYFLYNPADMQSIGGSIKRTESQYFADWAADYRTLHAETSYMMGDDGIISLPVGGIAYTDTDFMDKSINTFKQEQLAKYADIITYAHANPVLNGFKIGLNDRSRSASKLGDFNLQEYHAYVTAIDADAQLRNIDIADGSTLMTYDDYLTPNNPLGTLGVLIYVDPWDTFNAYGGQAVTWDRSNRGPMSVLSRHLVVANDKTYLAYVTGGDFIYNGGIAHNNSYIYGGRDGVWLKDGTFDYMSKANFVMPDISNIKHWETYFPAMGIDFGVPDVSGYNGGVRNFKWQDGLDLDWADGSVLQENNLSDVSVDLNLDSINVANNWTTGRSVRFKGASLPSPLLINTTYYVINVDATHVKIATSAANATAGTAINLTSAGVGNFTLHYVSYVGGNAKANDVWRRDYANAIVLHRTHSWATIADEYNTYSAPIDLGGVYYPLDAAGNTGAGISNISLRANEGAVLMKTPLGADVIAPSAPSGLNVL